MLLVSEGMLLQDLHCPACAIRAERRIEAIQGVEAARIDPSNNHVTLTYDSTSIHRDDLLSAVAQVNRGVIHVDEDTTRVRWPSILAGLSGLFWGVGIILQLVGGGPILGGLLGEAFTLSALAYGVAALAGGIPIFRGGLAQVRRKRWGVDLLVSIALIGALALGELFEAASLAFLFSVAEWLEEWARERGRRSVENLLDRAPKTATVRRDGREISLPVEAISPGEVIIVRPGEKIALDGVVREGASWVNEAEITGESVPVSKERDAQVYAGTLSEGGFLEIEVTSPAGENTIAKIARLISEAEEGKAPIQRLIDRYARFYTPAVVGAALLVVGGAVVLGLPLRPWLLRALTLLVLACPCALVLATPVAIVTALSASARQGILIKGGAYLERLSQLKFVAMDKTGTLTTGELEAEVTSLSEESSEYVLRIAAALEARSEHPIARAILRYAKGLPPLDVSQFEAIAGKGVCGTISGHKYYAGRPELFPDTPPSLAGILHDERTVVLVGTKEKVLGAILLSDRIRPEACQALKQLRALGMQPALLTGDRHPVAMQVAQELDIDEIHAGLLPEEKMEVLEDLHARGGVAMVGDGVNDAPALTLADVGIAMGIIGADVSLETADVVLMSDNLSDIPDLVRLSRRTLRVARGNIMIALALKLVVAVLAFAGSASLALAVLVGDVGGTLFITINALMLVRLRPRQARLEAPAETGDA